MRVAAVVVAVCAALTVGWIVALPGAADAGGVDSGVAPAVPPVAGDPAQQASPVTASGGATGANAANPADPALPRPIVDPAWLERVAQVTGIPPRALQAYASADLALAAEEPACVIGWNTLAAIGAIESDHGRHGGAVLDDSGYSTPAIRGPALDGNGVAELGDTDGGSWDGDTRWDRAVGPLQFIPDTWERWGVDGSGDGVADPNQIDDAALAAARYLCASGTMADAASWRAAVFSYNHLDSYVDDVAAVANRYAAAAG